MLRIDSMGGRVNRNKEKAIIVIWDKFNRSTLNRRGSRWRVVKWLDLGKVLKAELQEFLMD